MKDITEECKGNKARQKVRHELDDRNSHEDASDDRWAISHWLDNGWEEEVAGNERSED